VSSFREVCIEHLRSNRERCAALLESPLAFAAVWVPRLDYDKARAIIDEQGGDPEKVRKALEDYGCANLSGAGVSRQAGI
jgi:aspartate ammonia-lyase